MRACIIAAMAALLLAAPAAAQRLDETPRIAVMSAFLPEWRALRAMLEEPREHEDNGVTFVTGRIAGRDVVIFLSGVSMVNAAMTTQMALDRFAVDAIVFSGIAGAIDPSLSLGDLVVAERWGPYLHMVIARQGEDGYEVPPFYGTPFDNYGMIHPQPVELRREGGKGFEERFWFEVDPELLQTARRAAASVTLSRCDAQGTCLEDAPDVLVGGNGVSGSAFVDNADFRRYVFATFRAQLVDMESAAVAHVAYANDIPFIAIRSLSDLAGGGAGANEMEVFLTIAADNAAAMVRAFLEESAEGR